MSQSARPNILWICTDQQRYDTLGCYGNTLVHTPNLDRLSKGGIKFNHAYSQSPVCTPSRASFLTGRYPRTARCRQNGQMIPKDEVTVTRILAENGYNCGLSGKLHLAPTHPSVCPIMEKRIDDGYSVFHWSHDPDDGWPNNEYQSWLQSQGQPYKKTAFRGSKHVEIGMPEEYHQTTWCVNKAVDFIKSNARFGTPWMFSVNIFDPHHPFDPPVEYLERYLDKLDEIPLPNYRSGELDNKSIFQQSDFEKGAYNCIKQFCHKDMSEYDHRLVRAAYYAMVDLIDRQTGRLIEELEKCGQLDNTIIIFTSDHGEMLGDHGIYLKGPYFYDCAVRVPLIISWNNKIMAGLESDAMVELIDIAPTLLEAVGLDIWPGMQGKSFWKLMKYGSSTECHREDVMTEYINAASFHNEPKAFLTMLRNHKYKIVCQHGQDDGELYDMERDPQESYNQWNNLEYAEIRYSMLKRLCDRIAFTADPLPVHQSPF